MNGVDSGGGEELVLGVGIGGSCGSGVTAMGVKAAVGVGGSVGVEIEVGVGASSGAGV
ncbi:MAG: hypothetical protein NTAFB01_23150 [Nitrospira sp.]